MSTLRSALDELGGEDLRHASDEGLEADFTELERAAGALGAELARRAAEIDRRGSFERDGYRRSLHGLRIGSVWSSLRRRS